MRKFLSVGIVLALFAFFAYPASACKVSCAGGSCSGTGDCHCDGDSPHCTDANTETVTAPYVEYLQTWTSPGLTRVANAAAQMLTASEANDLAAYQRAAKNYNAALEKLTKTERQVISAWEAENHETASGPRQQ